MTFTSLKDTLANAETSSIYALKRRNDASAADPMAKPFVVAFVVFPTASRRSVISRTLSGYINYVYINIYIYIYLKQRSL